MAAIYGCNACCSLGFSTGFDIGFNLGHSDAVLAVVSKALLAAVFDVCFVEVFAAVWNTILDQVGV